MGGDKTEQFSIGMDKFLDEARRLAKFNQDTEIINVYDTFQENDTAYIIMEYLEGESLKSRLNREGKLFLSETEAIMLPIFRSLKAMHEVGIIHRDISPDNIFLTKNGRVKLLDFGAARYASATHSRSLTVIYKPGFAPEEQYQSHGDQGPWTDVYALAATTYKCLTGITPDTSLERKVKDTLIKPSQLGIKLPDNKEIALLNALNIQIVSRTKSTEAFLAEWESLGLVNRIKENIKKADAGKLSKKTKIAILSSIVSIATVISLILIFGGAERISSAFRSRDGMVRVPSIVNLSIDSAKEIATNAGIRIEQQDVVFSREIPKNIILSQTYEAGSLMDETIPLLFLLSGGVKKIFLSEIKGFSLEEAKIILANDGFTDVSVDEIWSVSAPGTVLETNLLEGEVYDEGTRIYLSVSKGINPEDLKEQAVTYEVPNVVGLRYEELETLLVDYPGIYLSKSASVYTGKDDAGIILSQGTPIHTILSSDEEDNRFIYVTVSLGIEMIRVPQLVIGKNFNELKEELISLGFVMGEVKDKYDDTKGEGLVLSFSAQDGTPIEEMSSCKRGTVLDFVISKGAEPTPTPIPKKEKNTKATATPKPTSTPKPTATPTVTSTATPSPTVTPSPKLTITPLPNITPKPTMTPSLSASPTPIPHSHTPETVEGKEATCTETGLSKGTRCKTCGEWIIEQKVISKKEHIEVKIPGKEASCTSSGLTEGVKCSACQSILVQQTEIPKKEHNPVTLPGKAPSCTETGLTEGKQCSVCHEMIVPQNPIPAKGHQHETMEGYAPSCTSTGLTNGTKCSVCHTILETQNPIPPLGHLEETLYGRAATCTESGLTEGRRCTRCGTITVPQQETPALGHVYDPGTETFTDLECNRCGYVRGHWSDWSGWVDYDPEPSDTRQIDYRQVENGFETKTVYHYYRWITFNYSGNYWLILPEQNYDYYWDEYYDTDFELTYSKHPSGGWAYGWSQRTNQSGKGTSSVGWYPNNPYTTEEPDYSRPKYKNQWNYREIIWH